MQPNREIVSRLAYVATMGDKDQKNAANARIATLRDAYNSDRRFPSSQPVSKAVEMEIWNWWHQLVAQVEAQRASMAAANA